MRPFRATDSDGGASTEQWQVSTAGGIAPVWRPDGKELYHLNPTGAMMAAPFGVRGATPELGAPVVLFQTRIVGGGTQAGHTRQYDVAPDGRFLINTELDAVAAPITLLMNWSPDDKTMTSMPPAHPGRSTHAARLTGRPLPSDSGRLSAFAALPATA